jgi:hypothetical protein
VLLVKKFEIRKCLVTLPLAEPKYKAETLLKIYGMFIVEAGTGTRHL